MLSVCFDVVVGLPQPPSLYEELSSRKYKCSFNSTTAKDFALYVRNILRRKGERRQERLLFDNELFLVLQLISITKVRTRLAKLLKGHSTRS